VSRSCSDHEWIVSNEVGEEKKLALTKAGIDA
jgi:hypothetical protein